VVDGLTGLALEVFPTQSVPWLSKLAPVPSAKTGVPVQLHYTLHDTFRNEQPVSFQHIC
jgi:hypothetical protein